MKRKLVLTKKFPFVELKEICVRQKREFGYDVSVDEYNAASPQKTTCRKAVL